MQAGVAAALGVRRKSALLGFSLQGVLRRCLGWVRRVGLAMFLALRNERRLPLSAWLLGARVLASACAQLCSGFVLLFCISFHRVDPSVEPPCAVSP